MILGKYKGRIIWGVGIETYAPHICFLPNKHEYWVKPLEDCLQDERGNSEITLECGLKIVPRELKDIFIKIRTIKKLLQCQNAELS